MSSLNQNYVTGIAGFRTLEAVAQTFEPNAVYPFNDEKPCGSVLFWIDSGVQLIGESFTTRQFLWGNLDEANTNGWGLMLEPVGGQLVLTARVYTALGPREASAALSGPGLPAFIERLILADFYYDGTSLYLAINGSIVAVDDAISPDLYQPSQLVPRLGGEVLGTSPASSCRIAAVAYTAATDAIAADTVGAVAGAHFADVRAAVAGVARAPAAPELPWLHAYDVAQNPGRPGRVTKSAAGVVVAAEPTAPVLLIDDGTTSIPRLLARPADGAALQLAQQSQPIWYKSSAFAFGPPAPAEDLRVTEEGDDRLTEEGDDRATL